MKRETVFLNGNGFLVTNTRFEVPGQTYVMGGVTSVKVTKTVPSKFGSILLIILGFTVIILATVLSFSSTQPTYVGAILGGLILLLGGALSFWSKKTVFHLLLTTAAGEQRATSSTNAKFMESLRTALTNAIIHRG